MQDLIQKIDEAIKQGQHAQALKDLKSLKISEASREELVPLTDLARRLQENLYAVKILNRTMKAHLDKKIQATPKEKIAYALALVKLGFLAEAERWLGDLDADKIPQVHEVRARIFMASWDYQKAAPLLSKYIKTLNPEDYSFIVANLNLAASYIGFGEFKKSLETLALLQVLVEQKGLRLIQGHIYELKAQALIFLGEHSNAFRCLDASKEVFHSQQNIYYFFEKKWRWVSEMLQQGATKDLMSQSEELKHEAQKNGYLEDLRDIDRRIGTVTNDQQLLRKVFVGTPYPSYRMTMIKETTIPDFSKDDYIWNLSGQSQNEKSILEIENVYPNGGHLSHLFICLTHDFYRPLSLGYVFSQLYPNEYMDPDSSYSRVYRSVERLRNAISDHAPIDIQWDQNGIQFVSLHDSASILIQPNRNLLSRDEIKISKLKSKLEKEWFSAKQAAEILQLSDRSVRTTLKQAIEENQVEVFGSGKSTKYRFAS